MLLSSNLTYLRSNADQQFCLDAKSEDVPCNVDSLPRALGTCRKIVFADNELEVDFINKLPPAIFHKILGMLDTKSLSNAARVSKKWKMMFEDELKRRERQRNKDAKIEGTDAYYEQLWELLMGNIEKTYGQRFPF